MTVETGKWFKILDRRNVFTVMECCLFFLRLSSIDLCKHTTVVYFSFRALTGSPTSVLINVIGLVVCAPLEIIVPWLCPGSEIFLAPPLTDAIPC